MGELQNVNEFKDNIILRYWFSLNLFTELIQHSLKYNRHFQRYGQTYSAVYMKYRKQRNLIMNVSGGLNAPWFQNLLHIYRDQSIDNMKLA